MCIYVYACMNIHMCVYMCIYLYKIYKIKSLLCSVCDEQDLGGSQPSEVSRI